MKQNTRLGTDCYKIRRRLDENEKAQMLELPFRVRGESVHLCAGNEHKDNQQHVRFVSDEATFGPPHLAVGVK